MPRILRFISKDPLIQYPLIIAILFLLIQITILVFGLRSEGESIFLHYTTYLGVDYVGSRFLVYGIPLASMVWSVSSGLLAHHMERKEKLLGYFFSISAAIGAFLLLMLVILLTRINR